MSTTLLPPRRTSRRLLCAAVMLVALGVGGCTSTVSQQGSASGSPSATGSSSPARTPSASAAPSSTPTPADPIRGFATERLASMTLEEKVASLFLLHRPGTDAAAANAFVAATGASGLILMGDNVPGTPAELEAQLAATNPEPELPLLIGIDEEGGDVQRLPWDTAVGADVLSEQAVEATTTAFGERADILGAAGVTLNFGIVADVSTGPESFIDSRAFGRDPQTAGDRVAAAVGAENGRVLSTLKHFPGHGAAPGDSHSSIPQTDKTIDEWRTFDAIPFERGIAAGADAVMMGHLAYTSVDSAPASLSAAWHAILRDELGFTGVVVTDDMLMLQDTGLAEYQDAGENAVRALAAGNTLLLYVLPSDPASIGADPTMMHDAVVAAVRGGRIPEAQIDADALALLELRRSLAAP